MRDAPIVSLYRDFFLEAEERDGAVELGKRTVDEPPSYCSRDDDNQGKCPDEYPKDGPQAISQPLEVKLEFSGRASGVQPGGRACRL